MARGLLWQTIQLSLGGGVETKEDVRAADPRNMDIARDVQFDELKGVQTRKPFAALGSNIFGGGTISNARRLAVVNGELVLFTSDSVYSWNAQQSAWVLRGTHLAIAIDEAPRFVTTGDQIDGDRAELNGTVVYAWTEGTQVYAAALDKTTGSVLVSPTAVSTAVGRPRLVALSTKILLFVDAGSNNLTVRAIDPASPATAIGGAGTSALASNFNAYYDVTRVPGVDTAIVAIRRTTTTSYSVLKVTAALSISSATPARTCDGPIACAVDAGGTDVQIIRANGTNIQGDLLTVSGLADVFTAQAIGTAATTPVNQVTVEYSTVKVGGQYQATAWWSAGENGGTGGFQCKTNTVDQGNNIGTQKLMPAWLGLASRAFERGGSIYAWLVFAGDSTVSGTGTVVGLRAQLQNTYFLYRSDAFLVAKATGAAAGGFSPSTGHLPAVSQVDTNSYAWCGARRRVIDLGGDHTGYADRDLDDITVTFDTTDARRTAQLGQTLYIGGGMLMQYDGAAIAELGFQVYPWAFASAPLGGVVPAGTYYYKCTLRWSNAQGEQERSTTATVGSFVNPGASKAALSIAALTATRKTGTLRPPAVEPWRTPLAPTPDTPFYLTASKDPTAAGDNGYLANDATSGGFLSTFDDNFTDSTLTTKETNPENGGVLEFLAPPPASIIIATDTRLFLADVAGDPDRVWYSRLRGDGEIASFHDSLAVDVPREGGAITALAYLNDALIVFRQTAVYALPGIGFDNLGSGQNLGPANRLSTDVGAISMESIVLTPMGLVFKSRKGWYLLDRGWGVRYIGGAVASFDTDTVLAATVVEAQHHVRILTSSRMLVWDYFNTTEASPLGQWAEWTISDGLHATMWNGSYVYLTSTGPKVEQSTYTGLTYGLDVESSWIKMADLQGAARLRWFDVLGEFRSSHLMRVRCARDYQYDGSGNAVYFDDVAWTATPTTVGNALQVRHSPTQQQCEAIKVRLTAVTEAVRATLHTLTDTPVLTSGTNWTATWTAASTKPGEMGNAVTLELAFELGANLIDVRDHFTWDQITGRWIERLNRIGVRIACQAGTLTVAALESAIAAATSLATLTSADPTPSKTINAAGMANTIVIASFSAGAYGSPTGEACKLTGLAMEVGVKSGIYRRLPAGQKT